MSEPGVPVTPETDTTAPVIVITPACLSVDPHPTAAAILVGLRDEGLHTVMVSPVRTGRPDVRGAVADQHPVVRLAGEVETVEPVRLYACGPPLVAARHEQHPLPPVAVQAALVAATARRQDVDLVVLADDNGVLTPLDEDGATLLDLIDLVAALGVRVGMIVVTAVTAGALHEAGAVIAVVRTHSTDVLGTVLATRPEPDDELGSYVAATLEPATGVPFLGSIPAGVADWDPQQFADRAGAWLPIR